MSRIERRLHTLHESASPGEGTLEPTHIFQSPLDAVHIIVRRKVQLDQVFKPLSQSCEIPALESLKWHVKPVTRTESAGSQGPTRSTTLNAQRKWITSGGWVLAWLVRGTWVALGWL